MTEIEECPVDAGQGDVGVVAEETADESAGEFGSATEPGEPRLDELRSAIVELAEQVRSHHARAEARERVIDRLHSDLERLRQGERLLVLRPVVTDLQRLRADLLHQAHVLSDDVTREQVADLLVSFALSAELALERCGTVPVRPAVGAPFSAREHRAVGLLPAETPEQDQTIGAVVADGYRDTVTDRVTSPAKVRVLRWRQPAGDGTPATEPSTTQGENTND